jgi:hypothetical protein
LNAGWRIALIPIDDNGTIRGQMDSGFTLVMSLGGLCFIGGVACLLLQKINLGAGLIAATPIVVVGVLMARRMQVKRNIAGWQVILAQCVDRELRHVVIAQGRRGRPKQGWMWRAVCEFKHAGQTFRVTPIVRMRSLGGEGWFATEDAANDFLSKAIDPGSKCQLRVNPNNPRETALFSG